MSSVISPGNARQIQHVVNESRLQFDVLPDGVKIHARLRGKISVPDAVTGQQQDGIQWRAQFVRERRQKIVFGAVGGFFAGQAFLQFLFVVFPFGDIAGDI